LDDVNKEPVLDDVEPLEIIQTKGVEIISIILASLQ